MSMLLERAFDPDEPRDESGRWTDGGGDGGGGDGSDGGADIPRAGSGGEPQTAYHGSKAAGFEEFKLPDPEKEIMVDRAIGIHVAKDPALAETFTQIQNPPMVPWGEKPQTHAGGVYILEIPPDSKLYEVDQPQYDYVEPGTPKTPRNVRTDQVAIGNLVYGTAFKSDPALFARFLSRRWNIPIEHATKLADDILHDRPVKEPIISQKPIAGLDDYIYHKDGVITVHDNSDRAKAVHLFWDEFKGKGWKGLKYINTSPMETEKVKDPTSYAIFDPADIKFKYGKDGKKLLVRGFDPDEPRDEQGRWTDGGGGDGADGGGGHPGAGYSSSARLDSKGVIHTSNVYDAQRALFEDRKVELKQPKQVSTLIHVLGETAKRFAEQGQTAPTFNLCNVSVEGTNLFCAESKGIPRVEMPVIPAKQTKAFIKYLKGEGYKVENGKEYATHLRATQSEISGAKVAVSMERIKKEGFYKRLVISRDDYILDGHHTWAGAIGVDAQDNNLHDDKSVKVARVDISIIDLIKEAEKWTGGAGKKPASEKMMTLEEAAQLLPPALFHRYYATVHQFFATTPYLVQELNDVMIVVRGWDESQHPRVPAGSPEGGQFGEGGGGGGGDELVNIKPLHEKPDSKFGKYQKLSVERTQIGAVRAAVQGKLPEHYAIDLVGSILEHKSFPLIGNNYDFEEALEEGGVDPKKLTEYSDKQVHDALNKANPNLLSGTSKRGQHSGHRIIEDILLHSITSKEGQERVADMMIAASKEEGAWAPVASGVSDLQPAVKLAMYGVKGFRGDMLDKIADGLPPDKVRGTAMGVYMKRYEDFLPDFVDKWTVTSETDAYRRGYAVMHNELTNRDVENFWMGSPPLTADERVPSDNLKVNLLKLYENTQKFYQEKYATEKEPKPDLTQKTVAVRRGVGGHADDYTPAPMESWTIDKNTPRRFGRLMAKDGQYSILTAKVPVSSLLMTFESLKGTWPPEEELKGKKEYVVLGSALQQIDNKKLNVK